MNTRLLPLALAVAMPAFLATNTTAQCPDSYQKLLASRGLLTDKRASSPVPH